LSRAQAGEELEVFVARSRSTNVKAYEGAVEALSSAVSMGVGIRVIVDGRQGFAYAGTLDDDVIATTLCCARLDL
jgi:PmbA protein